MGIEHAHPGRRLLPALFIVVLAALLVAVFALAAQPAGAWDGYKHGDAQQCSSCHPGGDTNVPPTDVNCTACHTGGFTSHTVRGAAGTCWSCHTPGQVMSTVQTAAGCSSGAAGAACHNNAGHIGSTTQGCTSCHGTVASSTNPDNSGHHVVSQTVKGLLTIKVAASVRVRKAIKPSGLVKPTPPGHVVSLLIQKRNSTGKWVKMTIKKVTPVAASSSWSTSYKPLKKGVYRMQAKVPTVVDGTNTVTQVKTAFKTFKVK